MRAFIFYLNKNGATIESNIQEIAITIIHNTPTETMRFFIETFWTTRATLAQAIISSYNLLYEQNKHQYQRKNTTLKEQICHRKFIVEGNTAC